MNVGTQHHHKPPLGPGNLQRLQRAHAAFAAPEQAVALPVDTYEAGQPIRVFVLDVFAPEGSNKYYHGDLVEAELTRRHDTEGADATVDVIHKRVDTWEGSGGIEAGKPGALTDRIRRHFTVRLQRDADAFEEIVSEDGPRAVIQQSQGSSQSRVIESLFFRADRDPEYRAAVQKQLGIDPTETYERAQRKELLQGLVDESDRVHKSDPEVQDAIEELRLLQDEAYDQGHVHVISAGNQGRLSRVLDDLEVDAPDGFFTNEMAGSHSIIVGATDDGSKEAQSDNEHIVAGIASPDTGAQVGADGVDRPFLINGETKYHTGSSYAGPQSGSLVVDMLLEDRTIPQEAILQRLRAQAEPIPGGEDYVGSGALRPE